MASPLLPQKRPLSTDLTDAERTVTATPTPVPVPLNEPLAQPPPQQIIVNKFQPYISYKPVDFTPFAPITTESNIEGFNLIEDIPLNTRRGFQYAACSPNPFLRVMKFGTTDLPPYKASLSLFDRSNETVLSKDQLSVSTARGWVSSRANVAISEGKVYWEFNIIKSEGDHHVRLGIGRRESTIEGPIGFDGYGYGIRDKTGQTVHLSRLGSFMDGFKTGDVIGMLVELPRKEEFHDVVRDQIAIRFRHRLFLERFDYVASEKMEHLLNPVIVFGERAVPDLNPWTPETIEGSKLSVYKNGEFVGVAFKDLYDFNPPSSELKTSKKDNQDIHKNNGTLGYYPTISVFGNGIADINAGPEFKYRPENVDGLQGLWEVYNQRIADDIVWDLVDEIEAECL